MSISLLPSGSYRAQIHDPRSGGNIGVGKVLGGDSTFPTRAEAEAARERARVMLRQDPDLIGMRRRHWESRRAEVLRKRQDEARVKREAIKAKLERWLSEGYEIDPATGCWNWQGVMSNSGYGQVRREGAAAGKQQAHRWYFERLVGPIPPSLVLDHLCCNRRCVNPEHLEPVSQGENIRRGLEPYAPYR